MDNKYRSYPEGFNELAKDMLIPNVTDQKTRENLLWNLVQEVIGA